MNRPCKTTLRILLHAVLRNAADGAVMISQNNDVARYSLKEKAAAKTLIAKFDSLADAANNGFQDYAELERFLEEAYVVLREGSDADIDLVTLAVARDYPTLPR